MINDLQIQRLQVGQNQEYWNAVEIMQNTLGSRCTQVHELDSKLDNVPRTYVAKLGGKTAGGLIWKYYDKLKAMQLEFVAVDPKLHKKGIGRRLVKTFEGYVAECVAKQAEIRKVMLDANHSNYTFFERLGWSFANEKPIEGFLGPVEMVRVIG